MWFTVLSLFCNYDMEACMARKMRLLRIIRNIENLLRVRNVHCALFVILGNRMNLEMLAIV